MSSWQSTLPLDTQEEPLAVFSPCRAYRYELWRRWAPGPYAMFIGLNPSTADETHEDPTVRRCINFAKDWGYSALCMTNLFAYRATDPKVMKAQDHPAGNPENDDALIRLAKSAGVVIAAWGTHGVHINRAQELIPLIPNLSCLGLSKEGHPKHPLYLKKTCIPIPLQQISDGL